MTLIICERTDCMYIKKRNDKHHQCTCTTIGMGDDIKCDSYMVLPDRVKEPGVQEAADHQCTEVMKVFEYKGKYGIEYGGGLEYEAVFDTREEAEQIAEAHNNGARTYIEASEWANAADNLGAGGFMDKILMPKKLTAENGAKALLIGEFEEPIQISCYTCDENGEVSEDCEECQGFGLVNQKVPVSWTTIKAIYVKAVGHFSQKSVQADANPCRACHEYSVYQANFCPQCGRCLRTA